MVDAGLGRAPERLAGSVKHASRGTGRLGQLLSIATISVLVGVKSPVLGAPLIYLLGILALLLAAHLLVPSKALIRWYVVLLIAVAFAAVALWVRNESVSSLATLQATRLLIDTAAFVLLIRLLRPSPQVLLIGLALGLALLWKDNPPNATLAAQWKYAFSIPIAMLVFAIIGRAHRAVFVAAAGLLGVVSLAFAHRSMAMVLVATAVLYVARSTRGADGARSPHTARVVGLGIVIAMFGFFVVPQLAGEGLLGAAVQKSFQQNEERSNNPLLGGRSEAPISIAAVSINPIAGQGHMPLATSEILARARAIGSVLGVKENYATMRVWVNPNNGEVNPHSVFMEVWISSGLGGLIVVLAIVVILMRKILEAVKPQSQWSGAWLFIFVNEMWDMGFSPFLAGRDMLLAAIVAVALIPDTMRGVPQPVVATK